MNCCSVVATRQRVASTLYCCSAVPVTLNSTILYACTVDRMDHKPQPPFLFGAVSHAPRQKIAYANMRANMVSGTIASLLCSMSNWCFLVSFTADPTLGYHSITHAWYKHKDGDQRARNHKDARHDHEHAERRPLERILRVARREAVYLQRHSR